MLLGKLDSHMQTNKTGSLSYTIYRHYSEWIKDLNVTPETLKLLEENKDSKLLFEITLDDGFFNLTPKVKGTKAKINSGTVSKLKSFCTAKEGIKK